jgi:hypothetical protein
MTRRGGTGAVAVRYRGDPLAVSVSTPGPSTNPEPMPLNIFLLEMAYLVLLIALFVVYKTDHAFRAAVPALGPLPASVTWFGATGGVLAGLSGIYFHNRNWSHAYDYWHYSRPFVGAVVGGIGALLYYVLITVGSTKGVTPNAVTFDVVAFLLAFGDEAFRELITKLTKLLFGAGDTASEGATGSGKHP